MLGRRASRADHPGTEKWPTIPVGFCRPIAYRFMIPGDNPPGDNSHPETKPSTKNTLSGDNRPLPTRHLDPNRPTT